MWSQRKVLITGASGMVGSWLTKELLSQKAQVTVLLLDNNPQAELIRSRDIEQCQVVSGDLRNRADVSRALQVSEADYIFHLGAQTIVQSALEDPVYTFESNIMGTWNLYEAIRTSRREIAGVVVASSDKAYGTVSQLPYFENTPLRGEGPYDVSKSCTDLIAHSYFKTYGIPTVITRCGNIYGGGDLNWSRIVPGTIRDLLNGQTPKIRSNGKFLRDYIYVKDIANAYMRCAELMSHSSINGEAFNFSRGEPLSVMDIYQEICKAVVGYVVEPQILNQAKHEIPDQHLSFDKATDLLKWRSNFSLEAGLTETVSWYREYFE